MSRRQFILQLLSGPAALAVQSAHAEPGFPNKPLWIVVPWPAGAPTDAATRAIADGLTRELGQVCNVDNRAGASGSIGSALVAKSRADGYTLLSATADTHSINPHVRSDLQYDAVDGFTPLVAFGTVNWIWAARTDLPVNNIKDLIALARQRPGEITYGSWGIGSTAHIAGALLERGAGISLNHVPFQGGAPAYTAIQGGHVDLVPFGNKAQVQELRAAGKVKILGYTAPQRSTDLLQEVPTLAEQGVVGAECGSWYAIMAPKGIPEDVRTRLMAALLKVLNMPETTRRIVGAGIDPVNLSGSALTEFLRREYQRYGAVVRQKGIKLS